MHTADLHAALLGALLAVGTMAPGSVRGAAPPPAIPETETNDVAVLAPPGPHRLLLSGYGSGVQLINGDSAKIEAQIYAVPWSNFIIDPGNRFYYVAETLWSHGNRGTRADWLAVYDDQLRLLADITLPGRLLSTPKQPALDISSDGRLAYVFNLTPAASVDVVNLPARKLLARIDIPGCGMVYPWGASGFASLCSDGRLVSVDLRDPAKPHLVHTRRFFDAEVDPVFEESLVDRQSGEALFVSYTGLVHPVQLGANPTIAAPWSLQEAAGLARATTAADALAWRPGGGRFMTLHKATGRLFVLMHPGAHWTHKESGTQIWVFDIHRRQRIARFALPQPADVIVVTQDARPLLFVTSLGVGGGERALAVLDPRTGEELRSLKGLSGGMAEVAGF